MELGSIARIVLRELATCVGWLGGGLFASMIVATTAKAMWGTDYDARNFGNLVWVVVTGYGLLIRPLLMSRRGGR